MDHKRSLSLGERISPTECLLCEVVEATSILKKVLVEAAGYHGVKGVPVTSYRRRNHIFQAASPSVDVTYSSAQKII